MKTVLVALLLLAATPVLADDAADMTATANGFYTVLVAQRPAGGGGIPDATGRARFAPYLSAGLNTALANAATAEARFKARNKSAPPLIEGDLFSSLFEGPTTWKVQSCQVQGKTGRCIVALSHSDPRKPAAWTDTLFLTKAGGWKIDDIGYDANFAFGNSGKLSDMLKMAQAEAP